MKIQQEQAKNRQNLKYLEYLSDSIWDRFADSEFLAQHLKNFIARAVLIETTQKLEKLSKLLRTPKLGA